MLFAKHKPIWPKTPVSPRLILGIFKLIHYQKFTPSECKNVVRAEQPNGAGDQCEAKVTPPYRALRDRLCFLSSCGKVMDMRGMGSKVFKASPATRNQMKA
jgi:hypothetical protein